MNDYEVTVSLKCTYPISAPTADIAEDMAYEYFCEAIPSFEVVEIKKEDEA